MSVTSATQVKLTVTTAEPPKNTTPVQPWKATGPIYYHNEYVNRAADLGCCAVTRLLIVAENSLPNRICKMALFAIVSFGFAMVDVIRAAWAKISGSRIITPVTGSNPPTTTATASVSTSTTEASSTQQTATAATVSAEETQEEGSTETEPNPLPQTPTYDRKAMKKLTKNVGKQTEMLAKAIAEVGGVADERPSADALTGALGQLRKGANKAAEGFAEQLSTQRALLKELNQAKGKLEKTAQSIQAQTHQFLTVAETQYQGIIQERAPELYSGMAPEIPPAQPRSKKLKPSRHGSAPTFFSPNQGIRQLSLKKLDIFPEPSPPPSLGLTEQQTALLRQRADNLKGKICVLASKLHLPKEQVLQHLNEKPADTWELEFARLEKELTSTLADAISYNTNLLEAIHSIDKIQLPVRNADIPDEAWLSELEGVIVERIDDAIRTRKQEILRFYQQRPDDLPSWVNTPPHGWTCLFYIQKLNELHKTLVAPKT